MQFKINISDIKILIEAIEDTALINKLLEYENAGQHFEKEKYPTGRYLIDLSEGEVELVVDSLSDHLVNYGLNDDGEPNLLGLQVEALIDIFNED